MPDKPTPAPQPPPPRPIPPPEPLPPNPPPVPAGGLVKCSGISIEDSARSRRPKQKPQRWLNSRCPRDFAVVGAFDFEITKIDIELPAFVD
jgi:hypothetical protein